MSILIALIMNLPPVANAIVQLPANARAALESQAKAITDVSLEYRLHDTDNKSGTTNHYSEDFQGACFYQHLDFNPKPGVIEFSFDGDFFYKGTFGYEDEAPMLQKFKLSDSTETDFWRSIFGLPFLDLAGFYTPSRAADISVQSRVEPLPLFYLKTGKLTQALETNGNMYLSFEIPDPALTALRAIGLPQEEARGRRNSIGNAQASNRLERIKTALRMEPKREVTLVLGINYGYGMLEREERTFDGRLIARTETHDWKYYDSAGIWLPSRCDISWFTGETTLQGFADQPLHVITADLAKADFNQKRPKALFTLTPKYTQPGTIIADRSLRSNKYSGTYTMGLDGILLGGVHKYYQPTAAHSRFILWFVIGNIVVILAIILVLLKRRKES
jgi:hypothetical protein